MPAASTVEDTAPALELEAILPSLKSLEAAELFKLMKAALAEAEKKARGGKPSRGAPKEKKSGSMPKGVVPPQLRKPRAWVDFTLAHALEHGWESFIVRQKRKDKETGVMVEEETEMPASVLHEGAHVYEGSVTEKLPSGKQLIHKDAMSLSKSRWTPKDKAGTHPELYAEFEASWVDDTPDVPESASESSSKLVVKKTAAERDAEREAKKAERDAEREAKKAEREAEREAKKAEREAEKEAKKAEREAEKASKKVKAPSKAPVPAAAVKKAAPAVVKTAASAAAAKPTASASAAAPKPAAKPPPSAASAAAAKPAAAAKVVKKAAPPPAPAPVEEWKCAEDGCVHPWPYKGKQYLRNSDNQVWLRGEDGSCADWQGVYLPAEDRIDDSVEEPSFEDEE